MVVLPSILPEMMPSAPSPSVAMLPIDVIVMSPSGVAPAKMPWARAPDVEILPRETIERAALLHRRIPTASSPVVVMSAVDTMVTPSSPANMPLAPSVKI